MERQRANAGFPVNSQWSEMSKQQQPIGLDQQQVYKTHNRDMTKHRRAHLGTSVICSYTQTWAEHIRSIAQSLYSMFPNAVNPLVRQLGRYLAYSRDMWKHAKTCTRIQNSISAFSPDGVSLIVEAISGNDPNCWAHNSEVSAPNSDQDQSPPLHCSDQSFPWWNSYSKRAKNRFCKRTLAMQGCGQAVKFCLSPALNGNSMEEVITRASHLWLRLRFTSLILMTKHRHSEESHNKMAETLV